MLLYCVVGRDVPVRSICACGDLPLVGGLNLTRGHELAGRALTLFCVQACSQLRMQVKGLLSQFAGFVFGGE